MSTQVAMRVPGAALEKMTRELIAYAAENGNDDFVMDLMDRIIAADSIEAVFAAQEAGMTSGQDFANRPFIIDKIDHSIWRPSKQANIDQGGYLVYAVFKATDYGTGDEVTLNCGGKTFVATLYSLMERGFFQEEYAGRAPDGQCMMITSHEASGGAYLQLQPFKRPELGSAKPRK